MRSRFLPELPTMSDLAVTSNMYPETSTEHSQSPTFGVNTPEGVASPTLAAGGSRLWRVLYLYRERLRKTSEASAQTPDAGGSNTP